MLLLLMLCAGVGVSFAAAPDTVSFGRGSILLGNGEAYPDRAIIVAPAALHDKSGSACPRAIGNGEEVRPLP